MKKFIISFFCFISLLAVGQENEMTVRWGLEHKFFFYETTFPNMDSTSRQIDTLRFFRPSHEYNQIINNVFSKHWEQWDKWEEKNELPENQKEYGEMLERDNPYLYGLVETLTPKLYFNFLGLDQKYYLDTIQIQVFDFSEYKGGGFFKDEAWYDILLHTKKGVYNYPVGKQLEFTGKGKATLRFWSDNYYPNMGLTPMGRYLINITFTFLSNGNKVKIETGKFFIDV